jgi:hypothetical protein
MINKRGYSLGTSHPIHFEKRGDGWAVFNAKTDKDIRTGLPEWEAVSVCMRENEKAGFGCRPDIAAIDSTP